MLAQRFLRLLDSDLTAVPKLVVAESGNFPAIAQFYADAVLRRAFSLVEGILTRGMQSGEFRRMDVHATLPLFAAPFLSACALEALAGAPHRSHLRSARRGRGAYRCAAARARARPAMMKRTMLAVVAIAAGAGVAGWWWLGRVPDPASWQGYADAEYVRVSPTLTGRIVGVAVARGDQVATGAPLFAQDDADDRAARDAAAGKLAEAEARRANLETASRDTEIAQARADLANLVATRDRIGKDLARNEELLRSGAASRQTVDQQRADLASAVAHVDAANAKLEQMRSPTGREYEIAAQRAMVDQARAALAQAEWQLDQRHVVSPVAALVADTYARPGETINAGTPVVSLLPPQNILVRFFVPETELATIHVGDRMAIGCDGCTAGAHGHGHVHCTAAGIHAAGDLQRVQPREACLSDRGTPVAGTGSPAQAGSAG